MTAKQKELELVRVGVAMCERLVARETRNYLRAVADVEEGIRDADSIAPAFYRDELAQAKRWLAEEKARLAALLVQEVKR